MERPLAGRTGGAAPGRKATLVGQEVDGAGVLRRVAVAVMTGVVAMRPMLAGTCRRIRGRAEDGSREWTRDVHGTTSCAAPHRAEPLGGAGWILHRASPLGKGSAGVGPVAVLPVGPGDLAGEVRDRDDLLGAGRQIP